MYVGVTGATGKIGRWLVRELLDAGHRVRAMVRPTREGFWGDTSSAVEEIKGWGVELFPADFGDDDSLRRFAQQIEVLVHNGYHHVDEDLFPVEWTRLNILASVKLYDAFWRAGGRQIIFISSGAVYGHGPQYEEDRFGRHGLPIDERTMRAPRNLYAAYKSTLEDITAVFKYIHHVAPSATLRPGGWGFDELLGFRNYDLKGVLVDETRRLLAGEEVILKLPPEICAVDGHDLGQACNLLIAKGLTEKQAIGDWYIAGNAPMSAARFREIYAEVFGKVNLKIEPVAMPRHETNAQIMQLGYQPRGSERTVREHLLELARRLG